MTGLYIPTAPERRMQIPHMGGTEVATTHQSGGRCNQPSRGYNSIIKKQKGLLKFIRDAGEIHEKNQIDSS
jgi:hypothetical protein